MDTKVNYSLVGLFVCVLGCALIAMFLWLTTLKHNEVYKTYVIYMREEVSGLSAQSPVRYNGVKVGYVDHIMLNPIDPQQVKIRIKLSGDAPVTTSTTAVLSSQGITGIDYIGLKALTPDAPPLELKPGEKYPVIPARPSLLMKLSASLQSVTSSVESLSKNISKVFDRKNRVLLTESLSHIELTTRALSEQTGRVASSIKFAEEMLKNGAQASEGLPGAVKKMNQTLDSVGKTAGEFSKTALSARKVMHKASASLDGISQSLVPSAQVLLRHLDVTAQSLSAFSTELGENPSMLLRGRSPKALGPGEGR